MDLFLPAGVTVVAVAHVNPQSERSLLDVATREPAHARLRSPIRIGGEIVGALTLWSETPRSLDANETSFVNWLCQCASLALHPSDYAWLS